MADTRASRPAHPDDRGAGVVIVGASVAGVRTAQALRAEGYAGTITMLDAESAEPYDKPPLSKNLLTGAASADDVRLFGEGEAHELEIDLRLGVRAVSLDLGARTVVCESGERFPFSQLVIASGARARRPAWASLTGVFTLRSMADAAAIRERLVPGSTVAIVGAGFIGAELASAAQAAGVQATLIDPLATPLARILGSEVGALLADWHRSKVATEFGVGVTDVSPEAGSLRVTLSDGRRLNADTVLVGIGVELNVEWLLDSPIHLDGGVLCDASGRALDAWGDPVPDVFAVGDVSRWFAPGRGAHVRVEHWTNAVEQSQVVARAVVDPGGAAAHHPSFAVWSDQFGSKIQMSGYTQAEDVVVVIDGERWVALYADGGSLVGVVTVNWPRLQMLARRTIASGGTRDVMVEQAQALREHAAAARPGG
ncbi:FAD-dependent oxidoreductase [Microcella alkalica]|nr:FAD-dependent oxidoreductase [Microcella alkalica]